MFLSLFLVAACSSYKSLEPAIDAMVSDAAVTVSHGDYLVFEPADPSGGPGVILYPGGLVEPEAYAAPARRLAEAGRPVVIVPMPSDLAVFAPRKAARVMEDVDLASRWILAGHSLGGAMAASFVEDEPDGIVGLSLWAAYPAAGKDLSSLAIPVHSITGSEDGVLDQDTWEERKASLPTDTHYVEIVGGNHAGFGDYGPQDGDGEAAISAADQQEEVVDAVLALLP